MQLQNQQDSHTNTSSLDSSGQSSRQLLAPPDDDDPPSLLNDGNPRRTDEAKDDKWEWQL